jgi:hypothetical protein
MPTFSLTGQLRFTASLTDALSTTDIVDSVTILQSLALGDGDGTGEANAYWRDVRTVTATTTDVIDLASLPVSVFGGTGSIDMVSVKAIYLRNLSAATALYYSIQDGSNPQLPAGGVFLWIAGAAATPGSVWLADDQLIEIQNQSGTSAQYEIVLVGLKAT